MVKPDPRDDYYAALELRPNADSDEIKKQFKKLARLYHPDRNPGKEEIFKEKFQKIQAAHEVLADPEQRARYDAERRKAGIYPYAVRPNNPVRNAFAGAYNPAPPRSPNQPYYERKPRPQPANRRNAYYTSDASDPTPSTGASRFCDRPPQTFRPTSPDTDAERRAEAWKAFGRASDAKRAGYQTQNSSETAANKGPAHEYANKPGLGRSNTTAGTRRTGYNPNVRVGDWEPQAQKTSSYATHNRDFPRPSALNTDAVPPAPPPPPPPPPTQESTPTEAHKPDAMRDFRSRHGEDVPFAEGTPRISTPYTQHGGETTYFSREFLRRSSSSQDAARLNRDASHFKPEPVFVQKAPPRARSASPSSRLKPGQPNQPGPATNDASHKPPPRARSKKDGSKPLFDMYSQVSSDADTSSGADSPACEPQPSDTEAVAASRSSQQRKRESLASQTAPPPTPPPPPPNANGDGAYKGDSRKIFNIPPDVNNTSTTGFNPFGTQNNEPVHTQFLSGDWNPKFQGSPSPTPGIARPTNRSKNRSKRSPMGRAPPPPPTTESGPSASNIQPNPFDPSGVKPQIRPTNGNSRQSTNSTNTFLKVRPPPPGDPPKNDTEVQSERPRGPVKFSSDEWVKQFQEPKWALPQSSNGNTSPTRGTVPSRRTSIAEAERRKARRPAAAATVHEETDESEAQKDQVPAPPKPQPRPASPDPMDIDTDTQPNPSVPSGRRLYPVAPVRPDWRDRIRPTSASNAYIPSAYKAPPIPTTLPGPPPGPPPKAATKTAPPPAADSPFNLSSMANVTPIAPSGQGIHNLSDLRTTLPFPSQPSTYPPKFYSAPSPPENPLPEMPRMPIGPPPPTGHLTQSRWNQYKADFAAYQGDFLKYDNDMAEHRKRLHELNAQLRTRRPDGRVQRAVHRYANFQNDWSKAAQSLQENMDSFLVVQNRAIREGFARE